MREKIKLGITALVVAVSAQISVSVMAADKPAAPFANPYLADSNYPVTHGRSNRTSLAGPSSPSHRLTTDEIRWKPVGPVNGLTPMYSGRYPNGKRVMWTGGYDRITKLDADSLEILANYAIGDTTYFGEEEIERTLAAMDKIEKKDLGKYALKIWAEPWRSIESVYRFLSSDNELYIPYRASNGALSLRVYGDAVKDDPASKIALKREWKLPPDMAKAGIIGVHMTSDGVVVVVTKDGAMVALSRDLAVQDAIKLPVNPARAGEDMRLEDFMAAFVRNGIVTDDRGGIYVVSRDYMHRVQWTGNKLSLDEADGGWSAPYPNEQGDGSGSTPALIGWGAKEDHLVIITDGNYNNNAVAFWRDGIPADWKGISGLDRRIAGITPIQFGVKKDERNKIENGAVVYGYGAFYTPTYVEDHVEDAPNRSVQMMSEFYYMTEPGHEVKGAIKVEWAPKERKLNPAWRTQQNLASSVCHVSGAMGDGVVYCWGIRNREYTLEAFDWKTGNNLYHYIVGGSQRYMQFGGIVAVAPNGAIDCGCHGGFGIVRINPKSTKTQQK